METLTEQEQVILVAKERGYSVNMFSGDRSWYSFMHERFPLNLQVYIESKEFEISHMRGNIQITTTKCGSFMNDEHFNRIEREIRRVVFDLL